jgi:hypothetical protein
VRCFQLNALQRLPPPPGIQDTVPSAFERNGRCMLATTSTNGPAAWQATISQRCVCTYAIESAVVDLCQRSHRATGRALAGSGSGPHMMAGCCPRAIGACVGNPAGRYRWQYRPQVRMRIRTKA